MPHNVQQSLWSLDLQSLLKAVRGKCFYEKEKMFSGVGSDSRKNLKGCIFFCPFRPSF